MRHIQFKIYSSHMGIKPDLTQISSPPRFKNKGQEKAHTQLLFQEILLKKRLLYYSQCKLTGDPSVLDKCVLSYKCLM